jgi:ankyrin repeat protein
MTSPLPARPSLEWLRKRAKSLLKQLRTTRPDARLADVQLSLAREHGFASWRALVAAIDAPAPLDSEVVARFLQQVGNGEVDEVRQLLAQHRGLVNAVGPHPFWGGNPQALHVAVETGRKPMVDLLLKAGADVNGSNDGYEGWSPLLLSIDRKHVAIERALRKRGARVGVIEALAKGDDRTALKLLALGRRALPRGVPSAGSLLNFARTPKAIDRLLELGVPSNLPDRWGATPIETFSRLGRKGAPLVKHLMARGIAASPAEFARMGDRKQIEKLIKADPAVVRDPQLLRGAVDFRHYALVEWLLAHGADPNARTGGEADATPLHSAAWNGDLRMVKLLLAHGADRQALDRQYNAPPRGWAEAGLQIEDNQKCRAVIDYFEELEGRRRALQDAPVPRKTWKPLMDAAFAGDAKLVRKLLSAGADPNMLSNSTFRHRPLHRAIEHKKTIPKTPGHEEVVRLLLDAGADPRRRALNTSLTAFDLAAQDEVRFLPLLLPRMGALTLFEACAALEESRLLELLRADPKAATAVDVNGWSPLHHLAASGSFTLSPQHLQRQLRMAKGLLAAGADPSATFLYDAVSPISVLYHAAGQHDNPAMVELLLTAGANPMDNEGIFHAADEGHAGALEVFARMVPADQLAEEATRCLATQLKWGRKRAAPWLIAHGADPKVLRNS